MTMFNSEHSVAQRLFEDEMEEQITTERRHSDCKEWNRRNAGRPTPLAWNGISFM
jgi:hypothetical protein